MEKRKSIMCHLINHGDEVFVTPVGSPDVVVGLLSTLAVPGNEEVELRINLQEIDLPAPNEEKDS